MSNEHWTLNIEQWTMISWTYFRCIGIEHLTRKKVKLTSSKTTLLTQDNESDPDSDDVGYTLVASMLLSRHTCPDRTFVMHFTARYMICPKLSHN